MLPTTRSPAVVGFATLAAIAALAALTALACHQPAARNSARAPNCKVDVLPHPPGDDYVEVGELLLEPYAADPNQQQFKDPYVLAATIHDQICATGADTLVTERNAAGIIVRGAVYRRATIEDVIPPAKPPTAETCEPACRSGYTCEGGTCVQHTCDPACGDNSTCGPDLLCHPNS
jgi:hypothetical protein